MKTMNRPFEGILGNTIELRIVERLIASPNATFNPTDLAKMTGISRDSATKAIKKLNEWNVMSFVERRGNMDLYKLNSDEPMVVALKAFNDSIIMRMFPEVSDVLEELEIGSG
jgi:DNA-binding transcriptional regulator GbsR (MarR family)